MTVWGTLGEHPVAPPRMWLLGLKFGNSVAGIVLSNMPQIIEIPFVCSSLWCTANKINWRRSQQSPV